MAAKDPIENKFKSIADEFEMTPSAAVWENIRKDLQAKKANRKKGFFLYGSIAAAIAILLLWFVTRSTELTTGTIAEDVKKENSFSPSVQPPAPQLVDESPVETKEIETHPAPHQNTPAIQNQKSPAPQMVVQPEKQKPAPMPEVRKNEQQNLPQIKEEIIVDPNIMKEDIELLPPGANPIQHEWKPEPVVAGTQAESSTKTSPGIAGLATKSARDFLGINTEYTQETTKEKKSTKFFADLKWIKISRTTNVYASN